MTCLAMHALLPLQLFWAAQAALTTHPDRIGWTRRQVVA